MANMTDFMENRLVDWLLRGQAFGVTGASAGVGSGPSNIYVAIYTATPGDAGGGTEVAGGSYARITVASTLANWAGTQSAGSTIASSGTGGQTSNNGTLSFPTPTADWGLVTGFGLLDAVSGGNLLFWGQLPASKNVSNGDPAPVFSPAQMTITFA